MGIYDREYVRMGPRSKSGMGSLRFISFNSWIIILNVAVFVIDGLFLSGARQSVLVQANLERKLAPGERMVARAISPPPAVGTIYQTDLVSTTTNERLGLGAMSVMTPLQAMGHMSTARGFFAMQVWRFITFQFLHANITHLFFNMFGLWIFGGMVEQFLGFKRYAAFYLTCGVFGAISYLLLNLLGEGLGLRLPGVLLENPYTPLVGASAGVFGVIMACAYIAPEAIVQLIFPPIPLKLKYFAYGYVAIAAFNLLRGGANAGGDAAHIGGAIAGFFFIRNSHLLRDFFDIFGDSRRDRGGGRGGAASDDEEVDRVLAKVAVKGLGSLTDREKGLLRKATQRGK
jgi:membrane associated rhomboid family serine protease